MNFENKNILITGATSGIGRETAKAFSAGGANVIIVGRNSERGEKIVNTIRSNNKCAVFIACDVTKPDEIKSLKNYLISINIKIDVLVNNAGVFITQALEEINYDDWVASFRANLDGAMLMTKAFIKDLEERKGVIVNNASVSGLDIFTSGSKNYMYGASKAALIKFSKLCALNYAPNVRVNVVCPGIVDTEIFENRDFSRFNGVIPMGYISKPEQIAKAIVFLASDEASYITGAVLPVDGGMSLK